MDSICHRLPALFVLVFLVLLPAAGCRATPSQEEMTLVDATLPVLEAPSDWPISTPDEQGVDGAQLESMRRAIRDEKLRLHSLLILRNGAIVFEDYYADYQADSGHALYSVTKSFVSTLVGIAIDQGYIQSLEQPAVSFFPALSYANPDERKGEMSLENVLTMTTGLGWEEGNPFYQKLYGQQDWIKFMFDLPMASDPGVTFNYCSGCSHILMGIIQQATGQDTLEYARQNLFDPLGIKSLTWESDRQDIRIGGWGLYLKPRDMAKLGYLYLNQGDWYGTQVVSEAWVSQAVAPLVSNGTLNYGYQWWVHPELGGYMALGMGGQMVYVQPDLDLIVVTTAQMEGHEKIFALLKNYILPAVID